MVERKEKTKHKNRLTSILRKKVMYRKNLKGKLLKRRNQKVVMKLTEVAGKKQRVKSNL